MLLNNVALERIFAGMKHCIFPLVLGTAVSLFASAAVAECSAVYKAKQDDPLRLEHSSIIVDGPCTIEAAEAKVKDALAAKGWTLLKVLSVSES